MSARWLVAATLCAVLILLSGTAGGGSVSPGGRVRAAPGNRTNQSVSTGGRGGGPAARDAIPVPARSNGNGGRIHPLSRSSTNASHDDRAETTLRVERIDSNGPAGVRASGQQHQTHQHHEQQREGSGRLPATGKAGIERVQVVRQREHQQHAVGDAKGDTHDQGRSRGNFTASDDVLNSMALDGTSARCLFHLHGIPKAGTTWLEFIVGQLDECVRGRRSRVPVWTDVCVWSLHNI